MWKEAPRDQETEEGKLDVRTKWWKLLKRDVKIKKDKDLRKEFNKEFQIADRRGNKEYYICKNNKDGNTWKSKASLQNNCKLVGSLNLK